MILSRAVSVEWWGESKWEWLKRINAKNVLYITLQPPTVQPWMKLCYIGKE